MPRLPFVTLKNAAVLTLVLGGTAWLGSETVASKVPDFDDLPNAMRRSFLHDAWGFDVVWRAHAVGDIWGARSLGPRTGGEHLPAQFDHFVFETCGPLVSVIDPFSKEGIPTDFKYLAVIESGLSQVVSPAGAAGRQFMKRTAPEYGLEVSGNVDERYHVEKATRCVRLFARGPRAIWKRLGGLLQHGTGGGCGSLVHPAGVDVLGFASQPRNGPIRVPARGVERSDMPEVYGSTWDAAMSTPL